MMEEMNAKVMENEELEDITEVEEAEESDSANVLVAGAADGSLAYTMIDGVRRLWGFVGAELAERKVAEKAKTKMVDTGYAEVAAEDSDKKGSKK